MINLISFILYHIVVVLIIIHIVMDNRQPAKTVAWALVIWFVPVVGMVLYFFFGTNTRKERMASQRSMDELTKRSMLQFVEQHNLHLPQQHRKLIDLFINESTALPFRDSTAEVYTDGYQFFPALMAAMAAAKSHIHIDIYIFEDDALGRMLRDLLIDKARQGVEVRLIYDDVGCFKVGNQFFERMREEGIEALPFLPVRFPKLTSRVNYRNHRKIVVVDGRIGYIGGMNINDRYFRKWRDTHLRITGDAVSTLQYVFLDSWITSGGSLDRPMAELYPMLGSKVEQHEEGPDRFNGKTIQIVADEPYLNNPVIQMSYEWTLLNAREYVYMQTPYFIPPEPTLNAIRTAALSGVDVRLMLPARNDTIFMGEANRSFYGACLEAGVRIFERGGEFMHSKTFVCDDYLSCIGSANIDNRSFNISYEANAYIYDEQVARRNKEIFLEDQKLCREITLEEFGKTGFPKVFFRHILHLFSPLL